MAYTLSQICAFLAMLIFSATYFTKNKKIILFAVIVFEVLYALQYVLLQAYTGFGMALLGIFRSLWIYFYEKKGKEKDKLTLIVLMSLLGIISLLTYDEWFSFLPLVGGIIYTYSIWQNSIFVYRLIALPMSICWIVYNILLGNPMGTFAESFMGVAELLGLIQYIILDKKAKKVTQNTQERSDYVR